MGRCNLSVLECALHYICYSKFQAHSCEGAHFFKTPLPKAIEKKEPKRLSQQSSTVNLPTPDERRRPAQSSGYSSIGGDHSLQGTERTQANTRTGSPEWSKAATGRSNILYPLLCGSIGSPNAYLVAGARTKSLTIHRDGTIWVEASFCNGINHTIVARQAARTGFAAAMVKVWSRCPIIWIISYIVVRVATCWRS